MKLTAVEQFEIERIEMDWAHGVCAHSGSSSKLLRILADRVEESAVRDDANKHPAHAALSRARAIFLRAIADQKDVG